MPDKIQFRRDTAANWTSVNPILAEGELGLVLTTMEYKIGDGVTAWNSLPDRVLGGTIGNLVLTNTLDTSATAAGEIRIGHRPIANRLLPGFVGPGGDASALQPFLGRNKIGVWMPPGNATTVPGVFGYTAHTATGTATARNVGVSNMFSLTRRLGYVSASTAASLCGARIPAAQFSLGNGSGVGGFTKVCTFGISDAAAVSGARMFVGMSNSVAAPTNVEPSTLTNCIGVGHRAADTTLHIFYGGSTAQTPINLGANFPANTQNVDLYELSLFSPNNVANTVSYMVRRLNTGDVATGTLPNPTPGVSLPAVGTLLTGMNAWRTNNATALAVGLDIMADYIETDV